LFFWVISDVLNNQVLWTTLDYWTEVGQPYTYWLYFAYLIGSTGMIVFLYNTKWLSVFVGYHLILTLFATIRYIVNIYQTMDTEPLTLVDVKNLSLTLWYSFMWTWILVKLKLEILHKSLKQ